MNDHEQYMASEWYRPPAEARLSLDGGDGEADAAAAAPKWLPTHVPLIARESAVAALSHLALVPANASAIVAAGATGPIVALLGEGGDEGKQSSAAALARLAAGEQAACAAIAEAGAIPPLIALLGGDHGEGAQREGAHALFALADHAPNRVAITEAGGIGPLVVLLGERSMRGPTSDHAEAALVRLSFEQANRVRIIQKLVSMLDGTEGAGAQEEAAAALAKLAQDSLENRTSIVDAGGLVPLLAMLEGSSSKAKENSVSAITHLAHKSKKIQSALTKEGGIPLIARVLVAVSASGNAKELMAAAHLCSLVAQAISQLTEGNTENQRRMAEAGAIPPLVSMVGSPNPQMQANAAAAIASLVASNIDNQTAVARTGAIAPLCTLAREGTPEVKEQSAAALWALAEGNVANKATIAKLGGIEPLVALLVSAHSEEALASAQGALISLSSKHAENRSAIARQIVKLVSKLQIGAQVTSTSSSSSSSSTAASSASSAANGAKSVLKTVRLFAEDGAANQIALAHAGVIPQLVLQLSGADGSNSSSSSSAPSTAASREFEAAAQREAAHAMLAMATGNAAVQALITRSAGVPPLIALVSKGGVEAQRYAARALWHLAVDAQASSLISSSGGVAPLVAMLSSDDAPAIETAASTISRLARVSPAVALSVADEGGIPPLVKLLSTKASPTTQQQAAAAIAEVGSVPATRDVIAQAGGIEALVALLASGGTAETAASALTNLARDGEGAAKRGGGEGEMGSEGQGRGEADGAGGGDGNGNVGKPGAGVSTANSRGAARRSMIAAAGGIEQLVQMLYDQASPEPQRPGRALASGSDASPRRGLEGVGGGVGGGLGGGRGGGGVGGGGGLAGTSPIAQRRSVGVACMAASALSDLAAGDRPLQCAIVAAGGVGGLLHLLRNGSPMAQEHATRAVLHLCEDAASQQAIVDAGVIGELVALSKGGTSGAQELAAQVISDLAKGAVAERDRVRRKAKQGDRDGSASSEAADGESQVMGETLLREGKVEEDEDNHRAQAEERATTADNRIGAIVAAGGIAPLVSMLISGNAACKEQAASALVHLSVDPANQAQITRAGGIAPIVTLLQDGTRAAHGFAAAALARLAHENADNQVQIAKRLVALLAPGLREGTNGRAAEQLWELTRRHSGAAARVVNAGAIAPLVALLANGPVEARPTTIGALVCLSEHDTSNRLAIATGLVSLRRLPSEEAKEAVSQMLAELEQPACDVTNVLMRAGKKARAAEGRGGASLKRSSGGARSKTAPTVGAGGSNGLHTATSLRQASRGAAEAAVMRNFIDTNGGGSAAMSSSAHALHGLLTGSSPPRDASGARGAAPIGGDAAAGALFGRGQQSPASPSRSCSLPSSSSPPIAVHSTVERLGSGLSSEALRSLLSDPLLSSSEALRSLIAASLRSPSPAGKSQPAASASAALPSEPPEPPERGSRPEAPDGAAGPRATCLSSSYTSSRVGTDASCGLRSLLEVSSLPSKAPRRPAVGSLNVSKAKQAAPQASNRTSSNQPRGVTQGSSRQTDRGKPSRQNHSQRGSQSNQGSQRDTGQSARDKALAKARAARSMSKLGTISELR